MQCLEKSGFLFDHSCEENATLQCQYCEKAVCHLHAHSEVGTAACTKCMRGSVRQARAAGHTTIYDDDPYFYGMTRYRGYGRYRAGAWGAGFYAAAHRREDFTEADAESLRNADDASWERDMGAS